MQKTHGCGPSLRALWAQAKRIGLEDAEGWAHIREWAMGETIQAADFARADASMDHAPAPLATSRMKPPAIARFFQK